MRSLLKISCITNHFLDDKIFVTFRGVSQIKINSCKSEGNIIAQ